MTDILNGIRVVELAAWTFVPAAGAVLADWGADVIKIEHPETGDPQRGLISSGIVSGAGGVNHFIEQPNRGKRSIGLDTSSPEGSELLMSSLETADVFLTNLLPDSRQRQGIDVDTSARATRRSSSPRARLRHKGDLAIAGRLRPAAYWARGGIGEAYTAGDGSSADPAACVRRLLRRPAIAAASPPRCSSASAPESRRWSTSHCSARRSGNSGPT